MPQKILVVDDEPDLELIFRQRFRRKIRQQELDFVFAPHGIAALEILTTDPDIDVVFTDINMPEMDGLTLLSKIAEQAPLMRTVIISAYGDMPNIRTAMNRGAYDFLTKPIDLQDLEVTLEKTLEEARLSKEGEAARAKAVALESRNQTIREAFGRYVSDEVVTNVLDSPEGLQLGGEKRQVSILMADLRGFTALAERLAPDQLVAFLNRYLEEMVNVILEYRGTINEILGDGIMVIFGAPIQRDDDARRAVACAVAMQLALQSVNAINRRAGLPDVAMGIGVHTGEVVIGNIGSQRRTKYGAVGTHVNLTGRIESYTIGGQILISETTYQQAGRDLQIAGHLQIEPKGVKEPITVYDVLGIGEDRQLSVPVRDDELITLTQEIPIRYSVLEEKHVGRTQFSGQLVGLSAKQARVQSDHAPLPLSNIKMQFLVPEGEAIPGECYGKVSADATSSHADFLVSLTSISPEVATYLETFSPVSPE